MIFYYSGCGNSRYAAESLVKALDEQLVFIPQAARENKVDYTLRPRESVGFVFPIYSWRPPQLVLDFVGRLRLAGTPAYTFMLATYGDDAGMADAVLGKTLSAVGLRLDAAFGLPMPNTYVNMPFMNVDSSQVEQSKLAHAKIRLAELAQAIKARRAGVDLKRGAMPRLKTYAIGKGFNQWVSDNKYRATDACVGCGLCARVCPLLNITIEDGHPRWNGNCTHCEACYHYCPQNVVQFGRATRGKGQYHYSD